MTNLTPALKALFLRIKQGEIIYRDQLYQAAKTAEDHGYIRNYLYN